MFDIQWAYNNAYNNTYNNAYNNAYDIWTNGYHLMLNLDGSI